LIAVHECHSRGLCERPVNVAGLMSWGVVLQRWLSSDRARVRVVQKSFHTRFVLTRTRAHIGKEW